MSRLRGLALGATVMAGTGALVLVGSGVTASADTHFYSSTTTVTASPGGKVGTGLSAVAVVTGHDPTCTDAKTRQITPCLTFKLFGPADSDCSGTSTLYSETVLFDKHRRATSGTFTTTSAGSYSWEAYYRGDSDNHPSSACAPVTITASSGTKGTQTGAGSGGPQSGVQAAVTPLVPITGAATGLGGFASPEGIGVALGVGLMLAGPALMALARRSRRREAGS